MHEQAVPVTSRQISLHLLTCREIFSLHGGYQRMLCPLPMQSQLLRHTSHQQRCQQTTCLVSAHPGPFGNVLAEGFSAAQGTLTCTRAEAEQLSLNWLLIISLLATLRIEVCS